MNGFVTRDELKTALEIERIHTREMIDGAANVNASILTDIRTTMREVQREIAQAAAGYQMLKENQAQQFADLKSMIGTHEAPIRRLRAYETLASGGFGIAFPAVRILKRAAAVLMAGVMGGGMGLFLFGMITR